MFVSRTIALLVGTLISIGDVNVSVAVIGDLLNFQKLVVSGKPPRFNNNGNNRSEQVLWVLTACYSYTFALLALFQNFNLFNI